MSYSAVYDVTLALRKLLHSQLVRVISTAVVTLLPPGDDLPDAPGVNLYLYRVNESPATKNRPWPGDRSTRGTLQPALGVELSYLLTPLGKKSEAAQFDTGDDAHTMLGAAMLALNEYPILNDVHIPAATGVADSAFDADLALSQALLDSFEDVKITLLPTNIDEISKIWAAINKPYRLSVAYEVSLLELTPPLPPPAGGGIVTVTGLDVRTYQPPDLLSVTPSVGALLRSDGANPNTVVLAGFGFSFPGQSPVVRIAGQVVAVDATTATDQRLVATLPADVDGGPTVDVRVSVNGRVSGPSPFVVSPWLARIAPVRVPLDPAAPPTLDLFGSGFTTTPLNVRFAGPGPAVTAPALPGTDTHARAVVPVGLTNGTYDVRLVLGDAAHSTSNARQLAIVPLLHAAVVVGSAIVGGRPVSTLTMTGARLAGTDVRLLLDAVTYQTGANANASQLTYVLGRVLGAGSHALSVAVDGSVSHTVTFNV